MFPIRDNVPSRTTPFVNYSLLAACVLVFFTQLQVGREEASLVERYGMIPSRITDPGRIVEIPERRIERQRKIVPARRGPQVVDVPVVVETKRIAAESAVPPWMTLLTCIFLHGGWMHIIGNMWFLWIFGDNVEDCLGHLGYLLFYVGCGIAASLAHLLLNQSSMLPTIGASGAVAGVMGAYFLLYPRAQVLTLIPIFIFLHMVVVPAPLFLGIWFVIQFFQGTAAITSMQTGVAWWAHIGGFAAGVAVIVLLKTMKLLRPPVRETLSNTTRFSHYRVRPQHRRWG